MINSIPGIKFSKGFSLIEVMLGTMVFTIGILGIAAMQVSTIKSNSFSGNLTEASYIGLSILEELHSYNYSNANLTDTDGDGLTGINHYDCGPAGACTNKSDLVRNNIGRNQIFDAYWNILDDTPLPNTKTIKIFITWSVKGQIKAINFSTYKQQEI
jgi:hypothetical protein